MRDNTRLKLGLPAGSLQEATFRLFGKAGFNIYAKERSYRPQIDDKEIDCLLLRAQEIPKYVERGVLDAGLTGKDWIMETGAKVREVMNLGYSKNGFGKVRLVIAVPVESKITKMQDLEGKSIATELVRVTRSYLRRNGIRARVEFSWGATEVKTPQLVDAISELTETGSSLRANGLRIVDTIMESTTRLICNKSISKFKLCKTRELAMLLRSALDAESKVGLKMNALSTDKETILAVIPALRKPTISELADKVGIAIETIVDREEARRLIPILKGIGASGIVEYPLNKVIE